MSGDERGNFFRKLRFAHDDGNMFNFHLINQVLNVSRRRINTGFEFNRAEILHAEAFDEINPVIVVGNKLRAFEWRSLHFPFGDFCIEFGKVSIAVAREVCLMLRINGDQRVVNILDCRFRQNGIEHVMGIPAGMHVACGVVGRERYFQGRDACRAIHVTRMTVLDSRVLACLKQSGKERVLAIESDQHDQVGTIQQRHKTRLHRHAMRVFDAGGEAEHFNLIAADLPGEVREVSKRGDDVDFGRLNLRRAKQRKNNSEQA